eukprot:6756747-Pyramimonas_sp.AAC.1
MGVPTWVGRPHVLHHPEALDVILLLGPRSVQGVCRNEWGRRVWYTPWRNRSSPRWGHETCKDCAELGGRRMWLHPL